MFISMLYEYLILANVDLCFCRTRIQQNIEQKLTMNLEDKIV